MYIFDGNRMGSIATVNWSKSEAIEDGDNPPYEEARSNLKFIAAANPVTVRALIDEVRELRLALRTMKEG